MNISEATIYEVESLAVLYEKYRSFYKQKANYEFVVKFIYSRLKNKESVIYILKNESNEIVGFTQLYPLFSSTRMKRIWLLNDLYILEKYRGLGGSKLLIRQAKKLCLDTNACELTLETQKDNHVANQLYINTGFTVDAGHNFYTWNP